MAVLVVHSHHLMEQSENADAVVMATQFPHLMGKSESDEDPKTNIKKRGNWKSTTTHCYNIFNSATEFTGYHGEFIIASNISFRFWVHSVICQRVYVKISLISSS